MYSFKIAGSSGPKHAVVGSLRRLDVTISLSDTCPCLSAFPSICEEPSTGDVKDPFPTSRTQRSMSLKQLVRFGVHSFTGPAMFCADVDP